MTSLEGLHLHFKLPCLEQISLVQNLRTLRTPGCLNEIPSLGKIILQLNTYIMVPSNAYIQVLHEHGDWRKAAGTANYHS
jgi:hypothetical protein